MPLKRLIKSHCDELLKDTPVLESCLSDIKAAFLVLHSVFSSGAKLLLCGNGGSAADCDHWSAELMKGFLLKRRNANGVDRKERARLPQHLIGHLQGGLPAVPLTCLTALNTATINDNDANHVFAQGVWALGNAGDCLVGISTSGRSLNVICAVQAARAKSMMIVGMAGQIENKSDNMRNLCDVCVCVPETETFKVQQLHLVVYHRLSAMLEEAFFGEKS